MSVTVITKHQNVSTSTIVRHVVAAAIPAREVTVALVPAGRGPRGSDGVDGKDGTLENVSNVAFVGGFF